jgi:hypothetical protein
VGGDQTPRYLGDQHVSELAEMVDRTVQTDLPPGDLGIGSLDEPAVARRVPTGSCRIDQQRGEPPHPPVDGDGPTGTPTHYASGADVTGYPLP